MSDTPKFYATMDSDGLVQIWLGPPERFEVPEGVSFGPKNRCQSRLFVGMGYACDVFPDLYANLEPGECKPMAPPVIRFLDPVEVPA